MSRAEDTCVSTDNNVQRPGWSGRTVHLPIAASGARAGARALGSGVAAGGPCSGHAVVEIWSAVAEGVKGTVLAVLGRHTVRVPSTLSGNDPPLTRLKL